MIAVDFGKYSDRAVEQQLPWIGLFCLPWFGLFYLMDSGAAASGASPMKLNGAPA